MSNKNIMKQRREQLEKLINEEILVRVGDQLVMPQGEHMVPLGQFVRKNSDEKDTVYFATPVGVILFSANKLHELSEKKAEEIFLRNLDTMLEQQVKHLKVANLKKVRANA